MLLADADTCAKTGEIRTSFISKQAQDAVLLADADTCARTGGNVMKYLKKSKNQSYEKLEVVTFIDVIMNKEVAEIIRHCIDNHVFYGIFPLLWRKNEAPAVRAASCALITFGVTWFSMSAEYKFEDQDKLYY